MSIYSINSYSSLSTRKGMNGTSLISGLDTAALVEQMTSLTRNKILKNIQNRQVDEWHQEGYRDITKQLIDFKEKYFSAKNSTNNILDPTFFSSTTIKNTSKYVNITGDTKNINDFVISDIKQLAQTAKFTSTESISNQKITTGQIRDNWTDTTIGGNGIVLKYGKATFGVSVDPSFKFTEGSTDAEKMTQLTEHLNGQIAKIDELKNADGTRKIEFSLSGGKVQLSNTTGNTEDFEILGGAEALMKGLKLETGQKSTGNSGITGTDVADPTGFYANRTLKNVFSDQKMTFSLDGVKKEIEFKASEADSFDTAAEFKTYLEGKLNKAFNSKVSVSMDADNQISFSTAKGSLFSVTSATNELMLGNDGGLRVVKGETNRIDWSKGISAMKDRFGKDLMVNDTLEFSINDVNFKFKETDTLSDIVNKINNSEAGVKVSYSQTTDKLSLTATDGGALGKINIKDSADSNLGAILFGTDKTEQVVGKDAIVEVSFDGGKTSLELTRSNNAFTVDGINIDILGKADDVGGVGVKENITFKTEANVEDIVTKVKDFIGGYNAIMKELHSKITEKNTTGYVPLTDEQKDEMTDAQVDKWEAEAKKGMFRNDTNLYSLMNELKSAMSSSVEGSKTALFKIGISTGSFDYGTNGQLQIDEAELRKAITEDPNQVTSLFTHKSAVGANENEKLRNSGISFKLENIINKYAQTSLGEDGILVKIAGYKGDGSEFNNVITNRMKRIDIQLESLKSKLQMEENRHWQKFSALESTLSSLNSQSQWLTQQMGG